MAELHQELLQRTSRITQLFKKTFGPICAPPNILSLPRGTPIPTLTFTIPEYVNAELSDTTTPVEIRNSLVSAIADLKAEYLRAFERVLKRSQLAPPTALHKIATVIQTRFSSQAIPKLMKHYYEAKKEVSASRPDQNRPAPKFNIAYIPYLKAYFNYNAYPSPHDRQVMAKKSMMSARQIEVWFQNHRRVEKKEGRPCVRRRASDAGPSQSQIDRIEQEMGVFGVAKEERDGTDVEREKEEYIRAEAGRGFESLSAPRYPYDETAIDILAMPDRPIPAFVPGYTPFLSGAAPTVYFAPPTWTRRPATHPLPYHHAPRPNFSELAEKFSTALRIYSDIPRVSDASVPPAATCTITTRLEPGCHPALKNSPARIAEAMRMKEEIMEAMKKEAVVLGRARLAHSRSPEPGMQRQVSWSSTESGSEESLPATPEILNVELEAEPEPFDDLFDEEPVHERDEVPLDIKGFVYADYPAPVITIEGKTRKKKSHYRT